VEAAPVAVSINAPAEVVKGSSFTVSVDIGSVTAFDAGQFDVAFNESLVELDNVTAGQIGATQIPVDLWNKMGTGTYRIIVNVPGVPGVSGAGTLAVLHFHAAGSAVGTTAVNLSNGFLNDNLAMEIPATWTGDSIIVSENPDATPPSVTTYAATGVSPTSATLNGNLTSLGTASSVQVVFEWGTDTSYGSTTAPLGMTAIGTFSAELTGISANTTYHFRAKAAGDGTTYGDELTFSTPALPPESPSETSDATTDNAGAPIAGGETPVYSWWVLSAIVGAAVVLMAAVIAGVLFRRRQMMKATPWVRKS
jgi:hypothetical protein